MTNCEHTTHRENTSSPTSPPIISSRLLSITSPSLILSMTTDNGGRGGGGGNGDNGEPTGMVSARGVQFFVVAGCRDALIRKIEARINVGNGMSGYDAQVEVFAKAGTYAGHETDGDAWERVYNGHVAVGDNDEDEDGGPPPPSSSTRLFAQRQRRQRQQRRGRLRTTRLSPTTLRLNRGGGVPIPAGSLFYVYAVASQMLAEGGSDRAGDGHGNTAIIISATLTGVSCGVLLALGAYLARRKGTTMAAAA